MKTLVFLYVDSNSLHLFDKVFDGNSAFYRSLKWADSVCDSVGTVVLTCDKYLEKVNEEIRDFNDVYVCSQSEWNVTALLEKIRNLNIQAWITSTDTELFNSMRNHAQFLNIKNNTINYNY